MTDHDAAERAEFAKVVGSGRQFAERIAVERGRRGWSQAELSRRMRAVGHPLDQAAISKIESPPESDRARRIDIDEAIGFAKVFDLSVEEMTLPMLKAHELNALRLMSSGAGLARAKQHALTDYQRVVKVVALAVEAFPAVADRFAERSETADQVDRWEKQFLEDVAACRADPDGELEKYKNSDVGLEGEIERLIIWDAAVSNSKELLDD